MNLWNSAFSQRLHPLAWMYNESISFDHRMAQEDIQNSITWAGALLEANILSPVEFGLMVQALTAISESFDGGSFRFMPGDEDIHTAVERRLTEMISSLGGKLHTGRSRNDQVSADLRLWLSNHIPVLQGNIQNLQQTLISLAEKWPDTVIPGYTHMQQAQPLLLSHFWLSHFWPLQRDNIRLVNTLAACRVSPLGSGALAGSGYLINRDLIAAQMGFCSVTENSLDTVGDRDFAAEFLFDMSLLSIHLSRLCEMVILYSSFEFGFFELSDRFSTGSSIMPQKKNPDIFELVRSKSGLCTGNLMSMLTVMKSLPSGYDKDLQADKELIFASYDCMNAALEILCGALDTLKIQPNRITTSIDSFLFATDIADYLVNKGIPFRNAHRIIGSAVRLAKEKQITLDKLCLTEWKVLDDSIEPDIFKIFDPQFSISRRPSAGGTSKSAMLQQLNLAKETMKNG